MTTTTEKIGDPVEFLRADPALVNTIDLGNPCIVSGADKVVHITESSAMNMYAREYNVSDILGSLYRAGFAAGYPIGGKVLSLRWYPSASYANNLSEALDRRPGEDVFRFVADEQFGHIPPSNYRDYLASGNYAQSANATHFSEFEHDRDRAHAIGVLLFPAFVTRRIIAEAQAAQSPQARYSLNRGFEETTYSYTTLANDIWLHDNSYWHRYPTSGMALDPPIRTAFWSEDVASQKRYKRQLVATTRRHLKELRPKLQALQDTAETSGTGNLFS